MSGTGIASGVRVATDSLRSTERRLTHEVSAGDSAKHEVSSGDSARDNEGEFDKG